MILRKCTIPNMYIYIYLFDTTRRRLCSQAHSTPVRAGFIRKRSVKSIFFYFFFVCVYVIMLPWGQNRATTLTSERLYTVKVNRSRLKKMPKTIYTHEQKNMTLRVVKWFIASAFNEFNWEKQFRSIFSQENKSKILCRIFQYV